MDKELDKKEPYSIGLDIGTSSIGWAVIGDDCNLRRYKHQNMWGAHLFKEADKAATRRSFRSSRRRLARRKRRITLLQQIFDDEIQKIDPHFYLRLSESMLHLGDKNSALELDANILFADHSFTDKSYREKYPTIYHLRSDLFHNTDRQDIRLVYLALHHIIKYRGNFLVEGGVDSVISSFDNQNLQKFMDFIGADERAAKEIKNILLDRSKSRSARKSAIDKQIQLTPSTKEAVKAVVGLKWDASKLFEDSSLETKGEFSSKDYEEQRDAIATAVGDENYELVATLESVYQWTVFSQFIRKGSCLSDIMIERYDNYRQDLSDLKSLFREFLNENNYKSFFHGKKSSFELYNTHKKYLSENNNKTTPLYKDIENILKNIAKDDPRYQRFEKRAKLGEFLVRQRIRDNGAIPHQIHQYELEKIIDNQAQYYPFLAQNRDKIISIFTFKLPYYIGPLKTGGNFAWSVKKKDGVIYPWNYDEMIDDEASAEKFIDRMRNHCTYLPDEEVLPKNSLLYQEYEVRNELKNITINGKGLDVNVQNDIVDKLFTVESSVTRKKLVDYLYKNQIYDTDSLAIEGFSNERGFNSSRKSYIDFTQKIGVEITLDNQQAIEEVIKWITLFEDKKILAKKLRNKYSDMFSEEQISKILRLNYSGWGRFSRKLLDGIAIQNQDGKLTVIGAMRQYKDNFMQIIQGDQYEFKKIIDGILSVDKRTSITYDDIKDLAGSPGIKRALWRSVRIIDEIVDTVGYEPKLISIEMARNEGEKVNTNSRKSQLEKMYKELIGDDADYNKSVIKPQLAEYKEKLNKKKYYLYFLQNGKCAYTGKPLDIENDLRECEIDHIIPRSLTKDDSLDNTVLVIRSENQRKEDDYPVSSDIQKRMVVIWSLLKKAKLMSPKKFQHLTSREQLSKGRIAGFVNRQLVETRQITKHLARMLHEKYHDSSTDIFTIRAGMGSEYRNYHDLPKSRDINDFHHAKDAYLAVIIAQFIRCRYPKLEEKFIYGEYMKFKNKLLNSHDKHSFIIRAMDRDFTDESTDEVVWQRKTAYDVIDQTMKYNDCLITQKTEIGDNQFYNQTIYGKDSTDPKPAIPRKTNLPVNKYGGYSGEKDAYCMAIHYINRGNPVHKIIGIPVQVYMQDRIKPGSINNYIQNKYKQATVLIPKIPLSQKIKYDGNEQFIVSSSEVTNAKQLKLPYDIEYAVAIALKFGSVPQISVTEEQASSNDRCRYIRNQQIERREKVIDGINRFWDAYIDKLGSQYQQFGKVVEKVKATTSEYRAMSVEDKIKAIGLVLIATHAGSGRVDMKKSFPELGLPDSFGRMANKTLDPTKFTFVYESITGLHRRELNGETLRLEQDN